VERLGLRVIIGILVLVVLLVGGDRLAAVVVAHSVAGGIASANGLSRSPEVAFQGVPFLTQVSQGRYREVDATLFDLPVGRSLVVDRLDAHLEGVHASASAALRGALNQLPIDRGQADGFIGFSSLERAANAQLGAGGVSITLSRAGNDRIAFSARIPAIIGTVTASGQARVGVKNGAIAVQLLPETLIGLPPLLRAQIVPLMDLSHLVPPMPFGFRATAVVVDPTGLKLQAAGTGLIIPI
jgi:hypothetical protein